MIFLTPALVLLSLVLSSVSAQRSSVKQNEHPYAPYSVQCPTKSSLTRPANCLNHHESAYVLARRKKASHFLDQWLHKTVPEWPLEDCNTPTLALALSGGGTKAGLTNAGVIQNLDGRESGKSSVKDLLQSVTYVSALSGGALTLSGIMANDFAKVSVLKKELYNRSFQNPFGIALNNSKVLLADVASKTAAGYPATLLDVYGRTNGYNFIGAAPAGADGLTWSNITTQPSFKDHEAPFPIITISQANVEANQCEPTEMGAIWEVSPFEFGSWDEKVDAFFPTRYMGSTNGRGSKTCTAGFDNIGFITGASSNILTGPGKCFPRNFTKSDLSALATVIDVTFPSNVLLNPYAIIPNPFHLDPKAGVIRKQKSLYGTDGGDTGQSILLFPFLQPERRVDVILAIDAQTYAPGNVTNGSAIYNTFLSAQANGLAKMPLIPSPAEYKAQNLSSRAQFFGCYEEGKTTIVYLPNDLSSRISNQQYFFSPEEIEYLFVGGRDLITQEGDEEWPGCLACGIMHKESSALPGSCGRCLEKYCWKPS
ncbi:hypothetical protein M409DRAFT_22559 [Zasmidium cellare ATCC 36951]|uniref:Lysophospholipase n=1 Tax=Zasmidium cellare ATCC 36951 TaxID=1080233 RepID=A0A6A6CIN1_ZASCE|nr:uncharacterized protein M409DRAFT_22559 [Zasmidium cellare ATCC 36951]KAF2167127.1 hypothetical protein M409DRAFT_22559 [Zasmidium cellare ATCC 36951]